MRAEQFDPVQHRAVVDAWCDARGMGRFPPGWLPRVGFIVAGVAALWTYATDSDVLFVEDVISSPTTTSEQRGEAIALLQAAVEGHARAIGARYLVGSSRNPRLLERAREHGYVVREPVHQIVKEVTP